MELFVPAAEGAPSPGATLSPVDRNGLHHRVQVRVVTLDEYVEKLGSPRVAFIKCDVEGHELAVFEGARRLLARDHIRLPERAWLSRLSVAHIGPAARRAVQRGAPPAGSAGALLGCEGLLQ